MLRLRLQRVLRSIDVKPAGIIESEVRRLLTEYGGGRPYFDRLDSFLAQPAVFTMVTNLARDLYGPEAWFVSSGHFGREYRDWARSHGHRSVVVAPGGLRYHSPDQMFEWHQFVGMHRLVFIDDSLYLGRSMRAVDDGLRRVGHRLAGTVVAYDGSYERMPRVDSLFRYFNES